MFVLADSFMFQVILIGSGKAIISICNYITGIFGNINDTIKCISLIDLNVLKKTQLVLNCINKQRVHINCIKNMFHNLDTIYFLARSSKNFSTEINFSENIFWVYRGSRTNHVV